MVIVHFNNKLIAYVNTGIDPGITSQTQSATQLTTQSFAVAHMMLWFAFTIPLP